GREAAAIAEELGDAGMVIDATLCVGIAYVIESRWAEAQPLLLEALEGALRRRRLSIPRLLAALAAVAAGRGHPEGAARLLGAAGEEADERWQLRTREHVRAALGDARYDEAVAAGAALDAEACADLARTLLESVVA